MPGKDKGRDSGNVKKVKTPKVGNRPHEVRARETPKLPEA